MLARFLVGLFLILAAAFPFAPMARAEGLLQKAVRVPATFAGPFGDRSVTLEGLVVRPDGPGPFPIAIINHGAPRDAARRPTMTPLSFLPQAREFARRGWAVLVVMRRGYGGSEGEYVESSGPCRSPDYVQSGERSAEDIRQAIRYMASRPYADPKRIISVGLSAGGFATVALTAAPPPGLVAAINFAGGRGSMAEDEVCTPSALVSAFGRFGKTSHLPTLWVYAENDRFFGPRLAKEFATAFTEAGGKARFVAAPPFGEDGHFLFSGAGIPLWAPLVDRFLADQGLALRKTLIALPKAEPPPGLPERARAAFQEYLAAGHHKAFAMSAEGAYGWRTGRRTEGEARTAAVETCAKFAKTPCRVVYLNESPQ